MKNLTFKSIFLMLLGTVLISISISIFRLINFGTDPLTCMNLGLADFFNTSFGNIQIIISIIFLILIFFTYKEKIGIGTLANMLLLGYTSDFILKLLEYSIGQSLNLSLRILLLAIAIILCCFGVALYMESNTGAGAYDTLGVVIEKLSYKKLSFRSARIITDVSCLVVGFLLHSVIGITTVIMATLTGPLIQFFRKKIKKIIY